MNGRLVAKIIFDFSQRTGAQKGIVRVSPDGRYVFSVPLNLQTGDQRAGGRRVVDTTTGRHDEDLDFETGGQIQFSPDGSQLQLADSSGRFRWLDWPSFQTRNLQVNGGVISRWFAISPDGMRVICFAQPNGAETTGTYAYRSREG